MTEMAIILKGEGDTRTQIRMRRSCEMCGEAATKKHTYLLDNARLNPASSAYGRDDCSWCEDAHEYLCDDCQSETPDGYGPCSIFSATAGHFAHMFLHWIEEPTP